MRWLILIGNWAPALFPSALRTAVFHESFKIPSIIALEQVSLNRGWQLAFTISGVLCQYYEYIVIFYMQAIQRCCQLSSESGPAPSRRSKAPRNFQLETIETEVSSYHSRNIGSFSRCLLTLLTIFQELCPFPAELVSRLNVNVILLIIHFIQV